ncbi:MAG: hypothetical protein L6R43_20155, partial [Planctomycetes bacterium]|nr:hypothetical protein [Planctomycetota bacterium]
PLGPGAEGAPAPAAPAAGGAAPGTPGAGTSGIRAQLDRLEKAGFPLAGSFRFLAAPEVEDVSLLSIRTADGRSPVEGRTASFEVVAANNGAAPAAAEVRLLVDGREVGSARLSLPGRGLRAAAPPTARATFPWRGVAGSHHAEAVVETPGNRLKANDRRGHAFSVRERVRVLVVDGDPAPAEGRFPETFLLAASLGLRSSLAPAEMRVVPSEDLARETLAGEEVIVLANVDRVPEGAWDRLASFVRRGGGLLLFLGDRTDPAAWNAALRRPGVEDLLPGRLAPSPRFDAENPVSVDLAPSEHPVLRDLADERSGTSFEPPLVSGWWPVQEPFPEGTEVLLRLRDLARTPWLLARHHGRGHVLLCTSSADLDWTGMSLLFAPLVQESVAWLADAGRERRDLLVHETLLGEVPDAARDISVVDPSGQPWTDLEALRRGGPGLEGPESGPRTVQFPETARAGRYLLRWKAPPAGSPVALRLEEASRDYAVNLDPLEADTARARPEAVEERLQVRGLGSAGDPEAEAREREREAARGDLTGLVLSLGA